MNQYKQIFGITRVPKPNVDILVGSHPCPSTHIIVLVKDQVYIVHVYDLKTSTPRRISIATIQKYRILVSF